jgi:ABC-2 type transport system permease protein
MNPTIVRLALAALAGRRRFWALLGLPLLVGAVVVLIRVLGVGSSGSWELLDTLWLPLLVPLLALLAASSVLGPELDDGSIVYLLAKPISRHTVIRSKYLVAATATVLLTAVPALLVGWAIDPGALDRALALMLGSAVSGLVYVALFLAFTASLRHSIAAAILFVFVWERTLGGLLSGVDKVSVTGWAERIAASVSASGPVPEVTLWWAWLASIVVTGLGVWWAGDRMRSYSMRGEE